MDSGEEEYADNTNDAMPSPPSLQTFTNVSSFGIQLLAETTFNGRSEHCYLVTDDGGSKCPVCVLCVFGDGSLHGVETDSLQLLFHADSVTTDYNTRVRAALDQVNGCEHPLPPCNMVDIGCVNNYEIVDCTENGYCGIEKNESNSLVVFDCETRKRSLAEINFTSTQPHQKFVVGTEKSFDCVFKVLGICAAVRWYDDIVVDMHQPLDYPLDPNGIRCLLMDYLNGFDGGSANQSQSYVYPPQANISGPQANVSRPQANVSRPQANVSRPQANVSRPQANVSGPQANVSRPQANVSRPQANVSRPQANVSRPQANVSRPQTNVSRPQANISRPQANVSRLQANVSRPQANTSRPQANVSRPQSSVFQPQASVSQPQTNVSQSSASVYQTQTNISPSRAQSTQQAPKSAHVPRPLDSSVISRLSCIRIIKECSTHNEDLFSLRDSFTGMAVLVICCSFKPTEKGMVLSPDGQDTLVDFEPIWDYGKPCVVHFKNSKIGVIQKYNLTRVNNSHENMWAKASLIVEQEDLGLQMFSFYSAADYKTLWAKVWRGKDNDTAAQFYTDEMTRKQRTLIIAYAMRIAYNSHGAGSYKVPMLNSVQEAISSIKRRYLR